MGPEATSGGVWSLLPVPLKTSFPYLVSMKAPTLVTKARQQVNRGKTKNRDLMRIKLFLFLGKRHVNTLPLGSSLKSDGKCAHETVQRIDVSVMTERKSETQSKGVCVSASQQWAISRDPGGVAGRTPPPEERAQGQVLLQEGRWGRARRPRREGSARSKGR